MVTDAAPLRPGPFPAAAAISRKAKRGRGGAGGNPLESQPDPPTPGPSVSDWSGGGDIIGCQAEGAGAGCEQKEAVP